MRSSISRILIYILLVILSTPSSAQYTGNISNATTQLSDTGSVARTVVGRLADATQATDFCSGTQITGGADASDCLGNAVKALCSRATGGILYLPAGIYLIQQTLSIPCTGIEIIGAGVGHNDPNTSGAPGTRLIASYLTNPQTQAQPVIQAKLATLPGNFGIGLAIRDMSIISNDPSSSYRTGPFIEIDQFAQVVVDNIFFEKPCTALKVNGGLDVHVSHLFIDNGRDNCDSVLLNGTAQSLQTLDVVTFDHVALTAGSSGNCFHIVDRVQTVQWKNITCETGGRAIFSECPTMSAPDFCPGFYSLYDFESEATYNENGSNLIELRDTIAGFKMTDSWLRGAIGPSTNYHTVNTLIYSYQQRFPTARNLTFSVANSWLKYAGGACLFLNNDNTQVIGNHIYGCNSYNVGGSGVQINGGRAVISGNTFCGDDWLSTITWRMASMGYINSGVDYTIWSSNIASPDTGGKANACQAPMQNYSSGSHNLVTNNVGP